MSAIAAARPINSRRLTMAGTSALLIGVGLARFAYTPMIPILIDANWFSPAEAVYLGAANLAGYLLGALTAKHLAAQTSARFALRIMMMLATASFFASAWPLPFQVFLVWRFVGGIAGAVLLVLAAPTILPHIAPGRRGVASGAIFAGVGIGIAASGTLVPWLVTMGVTETWIGLGVVSLALTIASWSSWPVPTASPSALSSATGGAVNPRLFWLYGSYALNAIGLVPHMVFLVDFIARGLAQGVDVGARYWILFGLGAILGPPLAGTLADRIGFAAALRLAILAQVVAVGLPIFADSALALAISSLVVGASVPGIPPLVLGRVSALVPEGPGRTTAWGHGTSAFALGQAGAAYGFAYLFAEFASYRLLFALAAAALIFALLLELLPSLVLAKRRGRA